MEQNLDEIIIDVESLALELEKQSRNPIPNCLMLRGLANEARAILSQLERYKKLHE